MSGIKSFAINGLNLIINTNDGKQLTMTFPKPADGISVTKVEIDANSHLICTMSDGSTIDAGEIKGGTGGGNVELRTASIIFDGVNDTFNLPISGLNKMNVYVNGLYMTEGSDYTLSGDKIIFDTVYDDYETCTITYFKNASTSGGNEGSVDIEYATKEDIDKFFE